MSELIEESQLLQELRNYRSTVTDTFNEFRSDLKTMAVELNNLKTSVIRLEVAVQYTQTGAAAQGESKKLMLIVVATVVSGAVGTVLGHIWK